MLFPGQVWRIPGKRQGWQRRVSRLSFSRYNRVCVHLCPCCGHCQYAAEWHSAANRISVVLEDFPRSVSEHSTAAAMNLIASITEPPPTARRKPTFSSFILSTAKHACFVKWIWLNTAEFDEIFAGQGRYYLVINAVFPD